MDLDVPVVDFDVNMNLINENFDLGTQPGAETEFAASTPKPTSQRSHHKVGAPNEILDRSQLLFVQSDKENIQPTSHGGHNRESSVMSFAKAFLSQDQANGDAQHQPSVGQAMSKPERKRKRARLLLDARTELTDEELKVCCTFLSVPDMPDVSPQVARAKYLESQKELRKEMKQKKLEKNASKVIENLISAVPWGGEHSSGVIHFVEPMHCRSKRRTAGSILAEHLQGSSTSEGKRYRCSSRPRFVGAIKLRVHSDFLQAEPPRERAKGRVQAGTDEVENVHGSPPLEPELQNFDVDFDMNQDMVRYPVIWGFISTEFSRTGLPAV